MGRDFLGGCCWKEQLPALVMAVGPRAKVASYEQLKRLKKKKHVYRPIKISEVFAFFFVANSPFTVLIAIVPAFLTY